jgi:stress response protein YsnF
MLEAALQSIHRVGRREWRKDSGYRQQARVENGFFRYKSLLAERLKTRNRNAQTREIMIGCHILNRMAELGRPESHAMVS